METPDSPDELQAYWNKKPTAPLELPKSSRKKNIKPFVNNDNMKKLFISFCAFAPQVSFLFCILLTKMLFPERGTDLWSIALPICLVCMPITFIWVLASLYNPKSEALAILTATLAVNGHFAFYAHLGYITLKPVVEPSALFAVTVMVSLACSGVALLLGWDNEKCAPIRK